VEKEKNDGVEEHLFPRLMHSVSSYFIEKVSCCHSAIDGGVAVVGDEEGRIVLHDGQGGPTPALVDKLHERTRYELWRHDSGKAVSELFFTVWRNDGRVSVGGAQALYRNSSLVVD